MFDDDALKTGTVVDGRFSLVRRLGHGGFGVVWLATDAVLLGREIALKVLHPQFGGAGGEQLAREADVLGRLDHPNIARAVAFSSRGAVTYLATEYVDGQPLHQFMAAQAGTPMARADVARIFDELCSAVAYAHARGVVHRDLKPQNVMIQRIASRLYVKVLDFGVAKLLESTGASDGTTQGRTIGSLFYMSPEQTRGDPTTTATDIFALGTMLFELLTLRRTWAHDRSGAPLAAFTVPLMADAVNSLPNVVDRIQSGPRPQVRALRPELSPAIDVVIGKALAFAPADRHAQVEQLRAEALDVLGSPSAEATGSATRSSRPQVVAPREAPEELRTHTGPAPLTAGDVHQPTLRVEGGVSAYTDEPLVRTEPRARPDQSVTTAVRSTKAGAATPVIGASPDEPATRVTTELATQVTGDDVVTRVTSDGAPRAASATGLTPQVHILDDGRTEVRGPPVDMTSIVETQQVLASSLSSPTQQRAFLAAPRGRSRRLLPLVLSVATLMIGAVLGMSLASHDETPAVLSAAEVQPTRAASEPAAVAASPAATSPAATASPEAASPSSVAPTTHATPRATSVRSPSPSATKPTTAPRPAARSGLAGLLRDARDAPTDAARIARLGAAITKAAERVPDAAQRASIRRIASSSAMIGNLAGLERAYQDLEIALKQAGEAMP